MGQRTPLQSSWVEDESVALLPHTYLQATEQCMGLMHIGEHVDKHPHAQHLRYCGGSEPIHSSPVHSKRRLTNFDPSRIAGSLPHQFFRRMWNFRILPSYTATAGSTATAGGPDTHALSPPTNYSSRKPFRAHRTHRDADNHAYHDMDEKHKNM